jgi:putative flippase GtrA
MAKRQFVYYCLLGGVGATLDFCLFTLILKYFGPEHYQIANAGGYAAGTIFSFCANAWLTFETRDRLAARFLAFCTVSLLGWLMSANLLALLVGSFSLNVFLAKIATLFAVVVLQYNLNRRLTFRKPN